MLFIGGKQPTKSRSHARVEFTCTTSFTQGYCYRNSSTTLTGSMEKRNNINTRAMNLLKRTFKVKLGQVWPTRSGQRVTKSKYLNLIVLGRVSAGIRETQEQGTCWSVTKSKYLNLIVLGLVSSTQIPKQVTKNEDWNTIIGKQQLHGWLISRVLTKLETP